MSIQLEQPITGRMIKTDEHTESKPRQMNFLSRLDGDTIFGIVVLIIIWGGFGVTFWLM